MGRRTGRGAEYGKPCRSSQRSWDARGEGGGERAAKLGMLTDSKGEKKKKKTIKNPDGQNMGKEEESQTKMTHNNLSSKAGRNSRKSTTKKNQESPRWEGLGAQFGCRKKTQGNDGRLGWLGDGKGETAENRKDCRTGCMVLLGKASKKL